MLGAQPFFTARYKSSGIPVHQERLAWMMLLFFGQS